ncbi:MAG: hypothetical protein ACE5GN_06820 [Waddliaceae bacterium]
MKRLLRFAMKGYLPWVKFLHGDLHIHHIRLEKNAILPQTSAKKLEG